MSTVAQDQFTELDKLLFFASRLRKQFGIPVCIGGDFTAARNRLAAAIIEHDLSLMHTTYGERGHATFAALFAKAFGQPLEINAKRTKHENLQPST
jgi:hypothetical protein